MSEQDPLQTIGVLLLEVSRLMRRDFEQRAEHLGLTQGQWRTLLYLSRCEGVNQAVLAERLEMRPITLARLIDRLESAGWVERHRDPNDRRAFCLYLQDSAQPMLDELRRIATATREHATDGLGEEQRQQLVTLLSHLKDNLTPVEHRH